MLPDLLVVLQSVISRESARVRASKSVTKRTSTNVCLIFVFYDKLHRSLKISEILSIQICLPENSCFSVAYICL